MQNNQKLVVSNQDGGLIPENHLLSNEDINTLSTAGVIPKHTPPAQVLIFAKVCASKQLDPFTKEIYLLEIMGKYHTFIGIQGLLKLAGETGAFAGVDDCSFDDGKSLFEMEKSGKTPTTCTATVYKLVSGQRLPFTATVSYKEFASTNPKNFIWNTKKFHMIMKVAKSHALKLAFSGVLSGLYVTEEEDSFKGQTISSGEEQKAPAFDPEVYTAGIISQLSAIETLEELKEKGPAIIDKAKRANMPGEFIERISTAGKEKQTELLASDYFEDVKGEEE